MKRSQAGFTLLELIVTIAVAAILLGWGIPSFNNLVASNRITAASNSMAGLLNFARSEAVRRGEPVWISPTSNDDWQQGVSAWINRGGEREVLRVTAPPPRGVALFGPGVTPASPQFGFDAAGYAINDNAYSLTLCSARSGITPRDFHVNSGGQVRATYNQDSCPGEET